MSSNNNLTESDATTTEIPNGNGKKKINVSGLSSITIPKRTTSSTGSENYCILLPHNVDPVSHFSLDIGGSLIKMVYYEPEGAHTKLSLEPPKSPIPVFSPEKTQQELLPTPTGGRICFARFRTANIEDCLRFIEELTKKYGKCESIHATGGGAFKFNSLLQEKLGITIRKLDEMESLILGLNFLLKNLPDETFVYTPEHTKKYISFKEQERYPYLLVNIGSGVSIVKVDGDKSYERVSGSSLGGGTFWGLCSLLTKCQSFEEILELTSKGDNRNVDMLVSDIYGRDYAKIGLSGETIASSFAKPIMRLVQEEGEAAEGAQKAFNDADIAKSLLYMICNNIGQIAYLNAMRYGLKRIYFAGYFIRDHPVTMSKISYAVQFWSKGEMQALFLKHEGYLGSIGSFFYDNIAPSIPELAAEEKHL